MDELLTVKEAAARLKMNERTILRLIASGELPASQPGPGRRNYRIRASDIEALISGQQKKQPGESEDPPG